MFKGKQDSEKSSDMIPLMESPVTKAYAFYVFEWWYRTPILGPP